MTQKSVSARLSNINLLTRDVSRARAFYEGAFGLRLDQRRSAPPFMLILGQGCTISLKDATTEDASKLAGPGDVELGFETDDLVAVHDAIERLGGTAHPIEDQGFGRTVDALDPDGHHSVVYSLASENR